jgi:CcmD family protein
MKQIVIIIALLVGATATARAQDEHPQRKACRDELERLGKEASAQGAEARAQLGPVTRIARMVRNMPACLDQLEDPAFSSELDKVLVRRVHEEEADQYTRDQRHVILAYVAIWVLTAGFVAFLFLRQGKLRAEIERLRGDLSRTVKDAEK